MPSSTSSGRGRRCGGCTPASAPATFAAGEHAALYEYRRFRLSGEHRDGPVPAPALGSAPPPAEEPPAATPPAERPAVVPPRRVERPEPQPEPEETGRPPGVALWPLYLVLGIALLVLLAVALAVLAG